jgi:hypothetical protein
MTVSRSQAALEGPENEAAVVQAASRILAALIRNGRLTNGNHSTLIRSAVEMAIEIARETDRLLNGAAELETGAPGERDILDLLDE